MKEIWERLEKWLAANAPDILKTLNGGASESDIEKIEKAVGFGLPADLKKSLMIHDGQSGVKVAAGDPKGLIEGWELLSAEKIFGEWQDLKELKDGGDLDDNGEVDVNGNLEETWWSPAWLPVTYSGTSDYHCTDLNPPAGGEKGQILTFWHDWEDRTVEAGSFKQWLEKYVDELEAGKFSVTEKGKIQRAGR